MVIIINIFIKIYRSFRHLGLPYDIGFGQRLFLRCRGHGVPTGSCVVVFSQRFQRSNELFCCSSVIFDTPTGVNSDLWIPLQENLKKITTVRFFVFRFD